LLDGIAHRTVQNDDNATYLSLRRPEDGEIDWTKPARELHDFVRAQTRPYPGAFTFLPDGRLLRVWSATVFPRPYHGIPGLVGPAEGDGVVVTCGDGALILQEVDAQDESGARESVRLKWAMRLGRSSDAMRGSAKSR
jgi:methionyl-tRNA formyltransferase